MEPYPENTGDKRIASSENEDLREHPENSALANKNPGAGPGLELVIDARLLHDRVGGVARFDVAVDVEFLAGGRVPPNFVIALALAKELAAMFAEHGRMPFGKYHVHRE